MPKHRKKETEYLIATTLGAETVLTGTLRFKDSLMIRGSFDGEIDAEGRLYIDANATVNASRIIASSVVIGGTVHGDIEAPDRVEMLASAKVYGNIRTARLRIADGVIFEGACEMIRDLAGFDPFTPRVAPDPAEPTPA
ncbi:MAG: bactofilin family protein [Rectinemataceae bacterium]